MIEKIPFETEVLPYKDKTIDVQTHASPYDLQIKINELVDAVNKLQKDYDNVCVWVGEQKLKTPVDKYAEQCKWIGCLCRFWNFKDGAVDIGILKAIDNLKPTIPYINDIDCSYAYCEPVKPTDSIIYKGE